MLLNEAVRVESWGFFFLPIAHFVLQATALSAPVMSLKPPGNLQRRHIPNSNSKSNSTSTGTCMSNRNGDSHSNHSSSSSINTTSNCNNYIVIVLLILVIVPEA